MRPSLLVALGTLFTSALLVSEAAACSCLPPDLVFTYNNSTDVLAVKILRKRQRGDQVVYKARTRRTYKGCVEAREKVILTTAVSSAACGVDLEVGSTYLVTGDGTTRRNGRRVVPISLCGHNRLLGDLTDADHGFLDTRFNCCGDECACVNSEEVQCFADPCSVSTCPQGSCTSNHCGGCHAEWYNGNGQALCTPCGDDADCSFGQHCGEQGQCLDSCNGDDDCNPGHWCRPTEDPAVNECAAFAGEGESCGGFTPAWAQQVCAPGLVCADVPPNIPDAPGVCRRPCEANSDCGEGQYCDVSGLCRSDGACSTHADCNLEGNDYVHIECVGYGVCGERDQCGWTCGAPQCLDLAGVDFGPCDYPLGAAVVNGACERLDGCDNQGFEMFESLLECRETCGGGPVDGRDSAVRPG